MNKKGFTKTNHSNDALLREAEGLAHLRVVIDAQSISQLSLPEILSTSRTKLDLTYIDSVNATAEHSRKLGEGLALLHLVPQAYFGYEQDNYIGLAPQFNEVTSDWGAFFVKHRLSAQVAMIANKNVRTRFEQCLKEHGKRLQVYLNERCKFPSLVHGDLWSGNVLFAANAEVFLIDPAVYFADSEVDIAMTEMFSGFGRPFYEAYQEYKPLHPDYPTKRTIYNLYHFLNHYNLFGQSYLASCEHGFDVIAELCR